MDSLEKLKYESWVEDVKSMCLQTKLSFSSWRPTLKYERDLNAMMTTSEMRGCKGWGIEFAQGRFDNYAAIVVRWNNDGSVDIAYPKDEYYFSRLCLLAVEHGCDKVLRHCQLLYAMASDTINSDVLTELQRMSRVFGEDAAMFYNTMLHVYYGMVAEEHYQRKWDNSSDTQKTRVGKTMKMHAIYRMLVYHDKISEAASECVNMSPSDILAQAREMGIQNRCVSWVPYSSEYDDVDKLPTVPRGAKKQV